MMYPIKKVIAIHDLSCYGRASLTTIIPIMSVMGIQVCPMPTAVLSTHTGGFGKPAILDLSDFIKGTKKHWNELNLETQCIYTGYLGSAEQSKIIKEIISDFKKENTLLVVDPVLGDNGKLYSSLDHNTVSAMKELVAVADVITPNITEVALLLDKKIEDVNNAVEVEKYLKDLSKLGPKKIVITSAPSLKGAEYLDTITYNKDESIVSRISMKKINKSYSGTGDAFASVLIGKLMEDISLEESAEIASKYIAKSVEISSKYDYETREGILLEKTLPLLIK